MIAGKIWLFVATSFTRAGEDQETPRSVERVNTTSAMLNGLLDFGNEDGLSGYIGGGVGFADVKLRAGT